MSLRTTSWFVNRPTIDIYREDECSIHTWFSVEDGKSEQVTEWSATGRAEPLDA
jgi:hypothetical protein